MARHDDTITEAGIILIQTSDIVASQGIEQPQQTGPALSIEIGLDKVPVESGKVGEGNGRRSSGGWLLVGARTIASNCA